MCMAPGTARSLAAVAALPVLLLLTASQVHVCPGWCATGGPLRLLLLLLWLRGCPFRRCPRRHALVIDIREVWSG